MRYFSIKQQPFLVQLTSMYQYLRKSFSNSVIYPIYHVHEISIFDRHGAHMSTAVFSWFIRDGRKDCLDLPK